MIAPSTEPPGPSDDLVDVRVELRELATAWAKHATAWQGRDMASSARRYRRAVQRLEARLEREEVPA